MQHASAGNGTGVTENLAQNRLGTHWLIDFHDCQAMPVICDTLQSSMEQAARLIGATIVSSSFHQFEPHGLSGVVIIGESHLAVHTWPEHDAICVDLFTCSATMNADPGIEYLRQMFQSDRITTRHLARGILGELSDG